jgi:hypothetical protein
VLGIANVATVDVIFGTVTAAAHPAKVKTAMNGVMISVTSFLRLCGFMQTSYSLGACGARQ